MDVFSIPFSREQVRTSLLLDSLPDFIFAAWKLVESTKLVWNWHLDAICEKLAELDRKEIDRLVINVPPGLGKSTTVTMWTTQRWARDPQLGILTSSYNDRNTIRDNRKARRIVSSEWFKQRFPARIASDSWVKRRFDTAQGGWRIATSVAGQGMGDHPHIIVLDDLVKAQDVLRHPETVTAATEYLESTIETRVGLNPAIVLIGQRLSLKDPAEKAFELGWDSLVLPMRHVRKPVSATDKRPDPKDVRKEDGELLFPDRYPEKKVRRMEIALGAFGTAAQLQQYPIPPGGALINRSDLNYVDRPPRTAKWCRGWDTAWTKDGGDWTTGTLVAIDENDNIYICHNVRAQMDSAGVDKLIKSTAVLDGRKVSVCEGAGSGKPVIAAHAKMLMGWAYYVAPEYEDKVTKAQPFTSQAGQGNVYIVKGEWNGDYIDVICGFPFGRFDDDMDSTVAALAMLTGAAKRAAGVVQRKGATWGRRKRDRAAG